MDTSKIIKGVVNSGRYTVTAPIIKEDYGLYLQIEGVELPQTYEVDFSNSEHNGTSVTMIGNSDGVLIPSQFISSGKDVFAFLYHVGADFGRTVYKFRIPNKLRPDRTNEQPTPEEQSTIDQAISALNTAVEQTAQDVIDADASAQSASQSAENAHDSAVDAQNYAETAQTSANNASASASQANTSATASAQSASQSAQIKADVEDLADDAQGYAQASAQSASASANSASQAQGFAQSASASAQSASGYASNAQTSANTASTKASEASTSAQTATQKATESAQSASQALTYKTDAESAKIASQTAQGLAESARDSAITAKNDAEQAKADAESARDEAQQAVASISGALADKAPVITDTASGAVASFLDGADNLPLKSLVVDIDPVQDLHGQDAPYPAGGGKNLLNPSDFVQGVTAYSTGEIALVANRVTSGFVSVTEGTSYTASVENGKKVVCFHFYDSTKTGIGININQATIIAPTEAYYARVVFGNSDDSSIAPVDVTKGQLELGSTATSYAPYENICPISGWTQVGVEQSGKNLFDKANAQYINGYFTGSVPSQIYTGNAFRTVYIPCKPNTTYRMLNKNNSGRRSVGYTTEVPTSGTTVYASAFDTTTTGADAKYLVCYVFNSNADSVTLEQVFDGLQIELGSTSTPHEPYTGRSITINLGQTVYGGKLDVVSGELVIDRAMVDMGTLTWNRTTSYSTPVLYSSIAQKRISNISMRCSVYKYSGNFGSAMGFAISSENASIGNCYANSQIFVRDDSYTDTATFKSAVSGVQLVYELAEPITIQLTPNQVNSLLGVNNIWSDSGDTTAEYRADTKLYIERLTAPDSADMIADANITSGQYFMVGNSLYKATANIANGSAIIVGTNCTRKSLSEALNEINA